MDEYKIRRVETLKDRISKVEIAKQVWAVLVEDYDFHNVHDIQQYVNASWEAVSNCLEVWASVGFVEVKKVGSVRKSFKLSVVPLKTFHNLKTTKDVYIDGLERRLFRLKYGKE